MHKFTYILLVFVLFSCGTTQNTTEEVKEASQSLIKVDTMSYALGIMQAQDLQQKGFEDVDYKSYAAAVESVMNGKETIVSPDAAREMIKGYLQEQKMMSEKVNMEKGKAFLAENAKREGVKVTESGLQYEVLTVGDGEIPKATSKVTTHYTGTLIDGTVFDSSVERGEPISFPVGGVIRGWQEALQLMPKGSKWRLYIPQDLAYGSRGAGNVIPPYATLIFDIELIEVE